MEEKPRNQEIDLLELLARFYGSLKENWILTIGLPVAGAMIGLLLHFLTPTRIQSKMMVVTGRLTDVECDFLLSQLEKADSLDPTLKEQLSVVTKLTHSIKKEPLQKDKPTQIELTVVVPNQSVLEQVQLAIMTFLEESEPARIRKAESKIFITQMIAEIDRELQSLEEVKNQFDSKTKATFLNPSDLFTTSLNLHERKINYQIMLKDDKSFRMVQGFPMTSKAKLPAAIIVTIGFVGGTFVLMGILFLKFFLGYYKRYQQTHPV